MDKEQAIRKAQKLMAVAMDDRGNGHEAERALAQAEALMRKFGIEQAEIAGTKAATDFDWADAFHAYGPPKNPAKSCPRWFQFISTGVANFTDTIVRLHYDPAQGYGVGFYGITTTLFIIAGLLSSLGAVERVQAMVSGIGFIAVSSRETLELRILVLIGIFVFAFFKFTWSLRQFNFTLMLFASAPMPAEKDAPDRADFAPRAAKMVTHGFASFNRGLRAYFFGLAALAWFIQPWALVLASSWVVAVLYWRDSRSATLATLAGPVTGNELP